MTDVNLNMLGYRFKLKSQMIESCMKSSKKTEGLMYKCTGLLPCDGHLLELTFFFILIALRIVDDANIG